MLTSSNLACSVHISLRISVLPIRRMLTAWSFGGFDPGLLVHVIFGQLLNSLLPLKELAQIKVMLGIPFLDNATAFIYPPLLLIALEFQSSFPCSEFLIFPGKLITARPNCQLHNAILVRWRN